jgi:hypothetical protein
MVFYAHNNTNALNLFILSQSHHMCGLNNTQNKQASNQSINPTKPRTTIDVHILFRNQRIYYNPNAIYHFGWAWSDVANLFVYAIEWSASIHVLLVRSE